MIGTIVVGCGMSLAACFVVAFVALVAGPGSSAVAQEGAGAGMREVVAGVPRFWPPQYGVDGNGEPVGFAIDVMNEIATLAGVRVSYRVLDDFAAVVEALRDGRVDIIPNSGIVPERLDEFAFTAPVEAFVISIFTREETSGIEGIGDLIGRRVAVVEFNVGLFLLRDREDVDLIVHRDTQSALFSLLSGEADALVYLRPVLLSLARRIGVEDRIKSVGAPLREVKRGIRLRKDDPELLARLDEAVRAFVGTPAYQAIYVKWYGTPRPVWTTARIAFLMGVGVVLILIGMAWWRHRSVVKLNRELRATIAEREAAQEALWASEERFARIFENSSSPTMLKDIDGRIILVNKSWEEWYGSSRVDAVGKVTHDIHPKEIADEIVAQDDEVLRTGAPKKREHTVLDKDGRRLHVIMTKFPVSDGAGRTIGIGTITTDITELRAVESRLQQAQKMEVVGQLTGGVAHDFNNLLAVVLGNLELAAERLADDGESLSLIQRAAKAADAGAALTGQMLAFSRRQILQPRAVDLNALVSRMTELLRRTLGETVEIETVTAGGLWPCRADPTQLETAVLNLALNARDAMPSGGKLTIETANVRLDDDYAAAEEDLSPGQYVLLAVSDTGDGMPPDVAAHAFEPFFTTKATGEGTGLGLSMVYGFAKQSEGQVKIYSEPGHGTTVKIYLPRIRGDEAAATPGREPARERHGAREKILAVEDDPLVREMAVAMLRSLNYDVLEAMDGSTALEILAESPDIDLLFTDVVLPGGMSGADLAREAERLRPGLKVLHTSGYTENAIIHQGKLDQAAELIQKPFQKAALARKIDAILGRRAEDPL